MTSRVLRWGGSAVLAVALTLVSAPPSFAPHVAQLQVNPAQAKAGEEVSVFGPRGYGRFTPVEIRWNSPTGPVLGRFTPNDEAYAMWGPGPVRIPEDAKPGVYSLYATQTLTAADTHIRGVPARGEITVLGPGGTPVVGASREPAVLNESTRLVEDEPVSTGSILLVALGVAGIGMFLAGGAALVASRRRSGQSAQPVAGA